MSAMRCDSFLNLRGSSEERLFTLHHRRDLAMRLWAYPECFREVFRHALEVHLTFEENRPQWLPANAFLDVTVGHVVARPCDLVFLCDGVSEHAGCVFLTLYVRHACANPDVVYALASDPESVRRLPEGLWLGDYVYARGIALLASTETRELEIEDLLPLGLELTPSTSKALLGAAMAGGRLSGQARLRVEKLYPLD